MSSEGSHVPLTIVCRHIFKAAMNEGNSVQRWIFFLKWKLPKILGSSMIKYSQMWVVVFFLQLLITPWILFSPLKNLDRWINIWESVKIQFKNLVRRNLIESPFRSSNWSNTANQIVPLHLYDNLCMFLHAQSFQIESTIHTESILFCQIDLTVWIN